MGMTTALFTHPSSQLHDTGLGHPESIQRIQAINTALAAPEFDTLLRITAAPATRAQLALVHPPTYINRLKSLAPASWHLLVDNDTVMSPGSYTAALHGAGAPCQAVDGVLNGDFQNAFCALRPPGHHAEPNTAMGFCLFGNIAIAAQYVLQQYGLTRVAIVDFDVHHGNGTQAALWDEPNILFISTHQYPLYPGTGSATERGAHQQIMNIPLPADSDSAYMRAVYQVQVFPCLHAYQPELLLVSAGYDAHAADPLANLNWQTADYAWLTTELKTIAAQYAHNRLIMVLEGGYNLAALSASVAATVTALNEGAL